MQIKDCLFFTMHPQIIAAIKRASPYSPKPNDIAQHNAEKVLNYIEDINLERNVKFGPTLSAGLFIEWNIGDWEYQMDCVKNGYIIYSFSKGGYQKASGCELFDDFIPQFEKYLLMLWVILLSVPAADIRCWCSYPGSRCTAHTTTTPKLPTAANNPLY